jgi:hypothetical protein
MNPAFMATRDFPSGYLEEIAEFFASQRNSLLTNGIAISKARDGQVPTNPFEAASKEKQLRNSIVKKQIIKVSKCLPSDFLLVVKHPNFFTATLSVLKDNYRCYAIIRNPLAVLLSWQSIQAPVNSGRIPYGEAFDTDLKISLIQETDRIQRQIIILRWYFNNYRSHLAKESVIRYEDIIATGGKVLGIIDKDAESLEISLYNNNISNNYNKYIVKDLAERLLSDESVFDGFYETSEIKNLYIKWKIK